MSAEGTQSARAALRLVEQAEHAIAQGDASIGRQLLLEAAEAFQHAGDEQRAQRLRAQLEGPPMANLAPADTEESDVSNAKWLPGPARAASEETSLPRPLLLAPLDEDDPEPSEAVLRAAEGPLSDEAPSEPAARLIWAEERRRGSSPLGSSAAAWADELESAMKAGATDYAEHVRATLRLVHPSHPVPATHEARFEPPGRSVREIDAAISAVIDAEHLVADLADDSASLDFGWPSRPPSPAPHALVGSILRGRFRLEREVGRGSQATVYLARDQVLERPVAVKVLAPSLAEDPDLLEGFLAEARMAARVQHAGCLSVFDFGREAEVTFFVMEYFAGRSLRALLRGGRLEPYLALHVAKTLAEALAAVHAAGIVHRDVKPSNVLVDRGARAKLSDFGVAVRTDRQPVNEGMMVGTLRYMAPEQAKGRPADPRSDLFSLGVVLWEMLAGRAAFEPTVDAVKARMSAPPPPLPSDIEVPQRVRELVERAMSPVPELRPATAGRFAEQLRRALSRLRAAHREQNR